MNLTLPKNLKPGADLCLIKDDAWHDSPSSWIPSELFHSTHQAWQRAQDSVIKLKGHKQTLLL